MLDVSGLGWISTNEYARLGNSDYTRLQRLHQMTVSLTLSSNYSVLYTLYTDPWQICHYAIIHPSHLIFMLVVTLYQVDALDE